MSIKYRSTAGIISDGCRPIQTYGGRYIPKYLRSKLKWWETDGLVTYVDRLKYEKLEKHKEK